MDEIRIITEPGMYFAIPDEVYHASPGLSNSGIKEILISPGDYWASYRDPDRVAVDAEHFVFGKAMHRRTLEGKDVFYSHYAIEPDMADYPDALTTTDQLKLILKSHKYEMGGTRADKVRRVLYLEPDTIIWDDILDKWKEKNQHDGKIILSAQQGKLIEDRGAVIDRHPDASRAFSNGLPEVSIFWDDEETGIRMKVRMDYLKINSVPDLKTFANKGRLSIDKAVARAMANESYYIQPYVYLRGLEAAKKGFKADNGFVIEGEPTDDYWLAHLINQKRHDFWFVFTDKGKAPNIRVKRFDRKAPDGMTNAYWHQAEADFYKAVDIYKQFMTEYPDPAQRWEEYVPASPFLDEEFPAYMID